MESFSDGVLGFAATLLAVDLALHPPGTALQQVLNAWPACAAYVISFLTRRRVARPHRLDRPAHAGRSAPLRLNLLLLLAVVFLTFPTRLLADALHNTSGEGSCPS